MCTNETNLSTSSLLKYLWMVYDMESSVYQQKELIKQLSSIKTPIPPLPPRDKGKPVFKQKKISAKVLKVVVLIALLVAVALIVRSPQDWLKSIAAVLFVFGLFVVFYLLFSIYDSTTGKAAFKKDVAQWEIDDVRRREYATAVARKKYIENEIQLAENKLSDSQQLLGQMYSKNVIYVKYRNLPAISSFLDYFSSGRCSSLTGPYGAYNLYENEARMDGIITRLDNISMQLMQIQYNQQRLYEAVKACGETVNRLYHAVENSAAHLASIAASQSRIEENSAMAKYRLERLEKESAYRNMMEYGVDYL